MASISAAYGVPTHAVYSASKHAVRALTEALSLELQPDGIRVCDVFSGYVATPMVQRDVAATAAVARVGGGVLAQPSAVAAVVWGAVQEDADPRVLHVMANASTWVADKLIQLDALLGLGLTRSFMARM